MMSKEKLETDVIETAVESFNVDDLHKIEFPENDEIIIDDLLRLDLKELLCQTGILVPEDSPKRIVMLARRTETLTCMGIAADMGNKDYAQLCITVQNTEDVDLPIFSLTKIGPLMNDGHKFDHSEIRCGKIIEDPDLSYVFTQLIDIFATSEINSQ